MTKENVLRIVESLPNKFELDELIEKLILIDKVEVGLEQLGKNKVLNHEMIKQNLVKL
jgi:hypothetical protein